MHNNKIIKDQKPGRSKLPISSTINKKKTNQTANDKKFDKNKIDAKYTHSL